MIKEVLVLAFWLFVAIGFLQLIIMAPGIFIPLLMIVAMTLFVLLPLMVLIEFAMILSRKEE